MDKVYVELTDALALTHNAEEVETMYSAIAPLFRFIFRGEVLDTARYLITREQFVAAPYTQPSRSPLFPNGTINRHVCPQRSMNAVEQEIARGITCITGAPVKEVILTPSRNPVTLSHEVRGKERFHLTHLGVERAINPRAKLAYCTHTLFRKYISPETSLDYEANTAILKTIAGAMSDIQKSIHTPLGGSLLADLHNRMRGLVWKDHTYKTSATLLMTYVLSALHGATECTQLLLPCMRMCPNYIPLGEYALDKDIWIVYYRTPDPVPYAYANK